MATMKTKSVGFNIDSEEDREALEHANQQPNFSGYVKRLILAEKHRKPAVIKTTGQGVNIRID
jgi:hypothetical protein